MACNNKLPSSISSKSLIIILSTLLVLYLVQTSSFVLCQDDIDDVELEPTADAQIEEPVNESAKQKPYVSPKLKPDNIFLFEHFDDSQRFKKNWIQSADSRYQGKWELNSGPDSPTADLQLLLPFKARHYAISSKLNSPFKFDQNKPFIVQYEVQYRDGLDCGGSYVKLLRESVSGDLSKVNEKTPYSIMFGPDKCGSESKVHFIIQYLNPKTQEYEEKHWKSAKLIQNLMTVFNDKKHHLFRLVVEPSNTFEIFVDEKSAGKGNLLEDFEPSINPPEEIVDVNDKKPDNWDERTHIEDPEAKKPDDWDENAPKTIEDPNASKPSDWLENEQKYIADPEAKKPDDWEEMDGEWQAPLIENPKCVGVSGCGEWKAPQIPNPNYKGQWKTPKISNPNYKGKWAPRMIPNPDYFFDENPFASLESVGAASFELWSMADNVAFDNFIITSDIGSANLLQFLTWQEKKAEADATSPSLLTRVAHYLKIYPLLWIAIVLCVAVPLVFFIVYCCDYKKSKKPASSVETRKKDDESRPDDEKKESDNEEEDEEVGDEDNEEGSNDFEEVDEESGASREGDEKTPSKKQVRQRKKN